MTERISRRTILHGALGVGAALQAPVGAQDSELRKRASRALRQAVEFFRTRVAASGGYLWQYSEDLARREGEARETATMAWVQPPGTPSVGTAFLEAYAATGDPYYRDAARETAHALTKGQLRSGGWDYRIEFDPALRAQYAYRLEPGGNRNVSTLDDDTTQSALRFLMRTDQVLERKDPAVRDAVEFGLSSLLRAQCPNGAWLQRYDRFPDPASHPVKGAAYPESWPRVWPEVAYYGFYTFNDHNIDRVIDTLLEAERLYGRAEYRTAVEKAGGFMLLSQMPDPQPAWAQQYNLEMHPVWARKFEPAAITGGESQGVLRTLLLLYRETGNRNYLEPVPRALDYLRRSRLPDGRLARFYELKTNRPLYFTKDYRLVYTDDDLPTHYGFKVSDGTDRIARDYEQVKPPAERKPPAKPSRPRVTEALTAQVREVVAALDGQGRWVEDGRLRHHGPDDLTRRVIRTDTFIRNTGILSTYLAATS